MITSLLSIDRLCDFIPYALGNRSGKVFYSGRLAFSREMPLYVLGVNPGGDPENMPDETVSSHTVLVRTKHQPNWSAYRDESWEGADPGTWKMQPRVLHMFRALGMDPGCIPCSNLVFVRSRQEADLKRELPHLVKLCWPFHAAAIENLRPRVVVCLGQTTGDFVRERLAANQQYAEYVEQNDRQWRSRAYKNADGLKVVVATHPSRVNWTCPKTDPTALITAALT
jgi:Uracil DNA glycosylase superfamily